MKSKSNYILEGIIVILVMMILVSISMPLFIKGQKIGQTEQCRKLVQILRDMCLEDPKFLNELKSKSIGYSLNLHGPTTFSDGTEFHFYVKSTAIVLDIEKLCMEYEELHCSQEIMENFKFYAFMAYQKKETTPQPPGVGFHDHPFYFTFSATNDSTLDRNDMEYRSFRVQKDRTFTVHHNDITQFDVTNGLESIGGFTYNSLEAMPLPTAVIVTPATAP